MKVDPVLLGVLTLVSALIIDIFLKIDIFYIILFTELIFKLKKKYIYIKSQGLSEDCVEVALIMVLILHK